MISTSCGDTGLLPLAPSRACCSPDHTRRYGRDAGQTATILTVRFCMLLEREGRRVAPRPVLVGQGRSVGLASDQHLASSRLSTAREGTQAAGQSRNKVPDEPRFGIQVPELSRLPGAVCLSGPEHASSPALRTRARDCSATSLRYSRSRWSGARHDDPNEEAKELARRSMWIGCCHGLRGVLGHARSDIKVPRRHRSPMLPLLLALTQVNRWFWPGLLAAKMWRINNIGKNHHKYSALHYGNSSDFCSLR